MSGTAAAAADAGSLDLKPRFVPLSSDAIAAAAGPVPPALLELAASSGSLVHDVQQMLFFAKSIVADEEGCTILWLQTRPKYGAPCTAVLGRQVVEGGARPQDLARRALRLLDPRPGAYTVRAPRNRADAADCDGLMAVDMGTAALYATTNPRSPRSAAADVAAEYGARVADEARRLAAAVASPKAAKGSPAEAPSRHRLDRMFLAAVQRETAVHGRARWRTLDVDDKGAVGACMSLLDAAGVGAAWAVETRGGVHLLLEPAALGRAMRDLAPQLALLRTRVVTAAGVEEEHEAVEVKTDCGCPLPGTMQGGFAVCFVDPAALPRDAAAADAIRERVAKA
ncbi:hypothetical protein FNF27_08011 [Cafeteria roenbergensis]|uniref:Uncharacterized protein n=1 Tax=Cafeteria roenbergensis TaxID=33653 RepID=A0A5A8DE80_CAFRO|nr:hypothetical protein FNF27_08011 [Cafeteria roenbergensis]